MAFDGLPVSTFTSFQNSIVKEKSIFKSHRALLPG